MRRDFLIVFFICVYFDEVHQFWLMDLINFGLWTFFGLFVYFNSGVHYRIVNIFKFLDAIKKFFWFQPCKLIINFLTSINTLFICTILVCISFISTMRDKLTHSEKGHSWIVILIHFFLVLLIFNTFSWFRYVSDWNSCWGLCILNLLI